MNTGRPRICFVVSSPMTAAAFLTQHVKALSAHYEVHLVVNADPVAIEHPDLRLATLHRARIERAIAPFADLVGLIQLARIFGSGSYAAVHSITPKAGLLTAIAAFAARVPVRVHTFTGQVWATRQGIGRKLLKSLDWLIARLDTHLLVDSATQRDFLVSAGVLGAGEGEVLGKGSVSGVDHARFRPDAQARARLRGELSIPENACVFLLVGRLNRDKGVLDLARAFGETAAHRDDVYLLLVGPDEEQLAAEIRALSAPGAERVRFIDYTAEPEAYMAASDVFCLPSYREGFGAVVIEAAAAGVPAIGSRIYGLSDAILDKVTGLLVAPKDERALASAMRELADDPPLRARLGAAARSRALDDFSMESSTAALVDFYSRALSH